MNITCNDFIQDLCELDKQTQDGLLLTPWLNTSDDFTNTQESIHKFFIIIIYDSSDYDIKKIKKSLSRTHFLAKNEVTAAQQQDKLQGSSTAGREPHGD